jgi:flagellar hook assembly protein FlgD
MRRLPTFAFGALAVATVAAVFITQHLKVTTPLIAGQTYGKTPHWIVPTNPKCDSVTLYFYVLHHADSFDLDIVDSRGKVVRTLATNVPGPIKKHFQYSWNGRLADGGPAPQGLYNFRLHLIHQNRTIEPESDFPISVQSTCPPP